MIQNATAPYALVAVCAFACSAHAQHTTELSPLFETNAPTLVSIDGRMVEFSPLHTTTHEQVNAISVRGRVGDQGSFVLARGPVGVEGNAWINDRAYTIRGTHNGELRVTRFHHHDRACAGAMIPESGNASPHPQTQGSSFETARGSDDPLSTRILIVYDQLAENDVSDMLAFAAAIVETANTSYNNSDISTMGLELAGIHKIENRPDGNSGVILRQLTNQHDLTFDSIHRVRDALDADIVAHLTELNDACGRGWLSPNNGSFMFTTTDVDCALGNLSFAHEVGHNQGCTHDPDNAGGAYVEYGYGHRWDSNRYRSVMAYSPGSRLMYFSNPDVTHNGFPTGIANQRDNARVLELTQNTMANHRVGDGTGLDCDLNALPDEYEIALDPSLDLDRNGELDACQILANPSLDCDADGTLDAYQVLPRVEHTLGIATEFGGGIEPEFNADTLLPEAGGDVVVRINANGDLGTTSEYLALVFNNGAYIRDVFTGSGSDCETTGLTTSFVINAELFNSMNEEGISLRVVPTLDVDLGVCAYMHLDVSFEYHTLNIELDANGDGVIDSCACPGDLNSDGELNFFDVADYIAAYQSMNPVADFNGDGQFNFFDVTQFIVAFNAGCP